MSFFIRKLVAGVAASAGLIGAALAHDPGLSGLSITVHEDRIDAVATFSRADIHALTDSVEAADFSRSQLLALAPGVLVASEAGNARPPASMDVDPMAKNNDVEFRLSFPRSAGEGKWTFRSALLGRLAPGHRQYLAVHDAAGRLGNEQLLRASADTFEIEPPKLGTPETAPPSTFLGFLRMGIEHILTGYDHLLFLGALLIVSRNFVSSLKIISCFTLGHSITLALATLNVVNLSGRIVEPLIAASIIYVSAENLLKRGEPRGRYLLTFAFGLVHGLGFASALREMGVGVDGGGVLVPLLGFNLGVELGQLSVAAVVLPIFWMLRPKPLWTTRWVPACSGVVALAGGYWLVERVAGFGL